MIVDDTMNHERLDVLSVDAFAVTTVSKDGMVTVSGGKWTTYRSMAEDAVDTAVSTGKLKPERHCCTARLPLMGASKYTPVTFTEVSLADVVC